MQIGYRDRRTAMNNITRAAGVYTRQRDIMAATLSDEEIALLSPKQGRYYGLDRTAARIWELLAEPQSVASLCERLASEYQIDEEKCRQETQEFLERLVAEGLISGPNPNDAA